MSVPTLYTYKVEVIKVIDGDSVRLNTDCGFGITLTNQSCRIAKIDTAESRVNLKKYPERTAEKQLGLKAKERLKELLAGDVILHCLKRDKYGRLLGDLYVEGVSVGDILVKEGLACPYDGGTKKARVREDGTWGI
jgi:micrococcal nuclease